MYSYGSLSKENRGDIDVLFFDFVFRIFRFFTIWLLGGRGRVQNIPGGSGNVSGYRPAHSENFYVSTFSADF